MTALPIVTVMYKPPMVCSPHYNSILLCDSRENSMTMSGDSQHSNSEIKKSRRFRMTATSYIKMRISQLRKNRRKKSASVAAAAPPVIDEMPPYSSRDSVGKGMACSLMMSIALHYSDLSTVFLL
jgi:hypothetical protein